MKIIAHRDPKNGNIQYLDEHSLNVGIEAANSSVNIEQDQIMYLLGITHDIGKADRKFQRMITGQSNERVKHSAAGAKYILDYIKENINHIWNAEDRLSKGRLILEFVEVLAYTITSHHGIYDIWKIGQSSTYSQLEKRIRYDENERYYYNEDVLSYFTGFLKERNINFSELIYKAFSQYEKLDIKLISDDNVEKNFYVGLKVRLYLSILKECDITDSINAYTKTVTLDDKQTISSRIEKYYQNVEARYARFKKPDNEINKIRNELAEKILKRGNIDNPGVYQLNLPTGAGKTLLSLRYSILQLRKMNRERMIYITPFLSVLEQNADEIKEILDDEYIVEHHSNIVNQKSREDENEENNTKDILKNYLLDSWNNPIVLSTMVQFFQTLFKGRSNNIRRFSALNNAVIILDEVQSLPIEVTHIFNMTMNFISKAMNSVVILCTATQPKYNSKYIEHPLRYSNTSSVNLVSLTNDEREVFNRTKVYKLDDGIKVDERNIINEVKNYPNDSILVILNTKRAVEKVFSKLKEFDRKIYYLSTNLCAQHRKDIISNIKIDLKMNEPIICVSTQLIEAGVDVDFNRLIRSYAGLDSLVQSIGRCNRNGLMKEKGIVKLANTKEDFENISSSSLRSIMKKREVTELLLEKADAQINLVKLNDVYYDYYFANNREDMDYSFGRDNSNAVQLLSINQDIKPRNKKKMLNQSFKTAADKINLITQETTGVIVYYKNEELIEELINLISRYEETYDFELLRDIKVIVNSLQPYTVNIYDLSRINFAIMSYFDGGINILSANYYDEMMGVVNEAEALVF